MLKLILFSSSVLLISLNGGATTAKKEADQISQILQNVILPKKSGTMSTFNVKGCEIPTSKWVKLFAFLRPVEHEFKFSENCDLNGKIMLNTEKFPVKLGIRKFLHYNQIAFNLTPNYKLNDQMQFFEIKIKAREGKLNSTKNSKPTLFEADYESHFDIAGRGTEKEKGEVRIQSIGDEKINFKKKMKF